MHKHENNFFIVYNYCARIHQKGTSFKMKIDDDRDNNDVLQCLLLFNPRRGRSIRCFNVDGKLFHGCFQALFVPRKIGWYCIVKQKQLFVHYFHLWNLRRHEKSYNERNNEWIRLLVGLKFYYNLKLPCFRPKIWA